MLALDYLSDNHPEFKPRVIVQLGAHQAWELWKYETLFQPKKVVWIDAVADHLAQFQERLRKMPEGREDAHSYVVALVAAENDKLLDFHEFSNKGAASSIYRGTPALFESWPTVHETGKVTRLQAVTLDTVLGKELKPDDAIDLMILDVQGAELECLRGATESLSRTRFLQVEVSYEAIYHGGVLFEELNAWLVDRGFELRLQKRFDSVKLVGDAIYERVADRT